MNPSIAELTTQVNLGLIALATLLCAAGMWLMLPRGAAGGRRLGALVSLASLLLFVAPLTPIKGLIVNEIARRTIQPDAAPMDESELETVDAAPAKAAPLTPADRVSYGLFYVIAFVTVASAAATVTMRNPVYSAIWFAMSLLGTAGLFLFQGAQFLGVATIVVYAGAILVTFLFVLMLAQPEGHAFYDRLSWETLLSAATGAVMVGILTFTLVQLKESSTDRSLVDPVPTQVVLDREQEILASEHMAHLGAQLFSRYLMSVEIAGTLLLVALVGTVAIVAQIRAVSPRTHHPRNPVEARHG